MAYKGNNLIDKFGYRNITVDGKRIREHRHVMETHLGRKLLKDEVIHHINHVKTDNRIENLTIMTNGAHTKFHHEARRQKKNVISPPADLPQSLV